MPEPSSVVGAAITAVASYLPERIVTNADLAQSLETSDEGSSPAPASGSGAGVLRARPPR